jgi:hypothetical protein
MTFRFVIGHELPGNTELVGSNHVKVTDDIIRFYKPNKQEDQAFALKNEDGTYEVCGILRADFEKGVFQVLRDELEIDEVDQERVFPTPRRLLLTGEEFEIFQKAYPHMSRS